MQAACLSNTDVINRGLLRCDDLFVMLTLMFFA